MVFGKTRTFVFREIGILSGEPAGGGAGGCTCPPPLEIRMSRIFLCLNLQNKSNISI